ncbi:MULTISPECIES: AraC family transcriptional regulator [Flavobacteriaceae]|uniref:AraC family transcriptional regulator n=1 Tax=Flavobacteriaceae TaxID=49546 RepID=UPI001490B65A|nr:MULTISPECIES: AraC family transcriptional regulator [Allomuricauda]MDC6366255.1 AraC family transcriptional regulator [Muricauda sp. AC10]
MERDTFIIFESNVEPGYSKIHSHVNYELNYVKKGWGKRFVGDYFSGYQEGDLVLLGPNIPHSWEANGDQCLDNAINVVIKFSENFVSDGLMGMVEMSPVLHLFKQASRGIQFVVKEREKIELEFQKLLEEDGIEKICQLFKLLKYMTEIEEKKYLSSAGYIEHSSNSDLIRINEVYKYIFKNFHLNIKLEELSDLVHLAPGSFCRFFKAKTGKTVFEVVKQVRIAYACKLLKSTSKTILQVSLDCGYTTIMNFYKQFKEVKGLSPKKYRELKF